MNIKQTSKRRTKNNDYRRFFVQDGNTIYWVHTNFDRITWIRERVEITEDNQPERTLPRLPQSVFNELREFHPPIQY